MLTVSNPLLKEEFSLCMQSARSRPLRSMLQWAQDEIVIPNGPHEGDSFRISTQPVMRLLLQEIDSKRWNEIYTAGPSQSGKTLVCFCIPIAYHLAEIGEDLVAGVPDMRMADDKWKEDLLPVFQASPTLRKLLPKEGPGSEGGKITNAISFANSATAKWMSRGGSDQSKAGYTARVVVVTEAAGFVATETSVEAGPLAQMQARQRSWKEQDRITYVEGTLTIEDQLPWSARSESSQSRIVSPCPHCGSWIHPTRRHVRGWQDAENELEAEQNSHWICPDCDEPISDEQREQSMQRCQILHGDQQIDKKGRITGEMPPTRRLWFHWTAWHNLFVTVAEIGKMEWKSARLPEESPEREQAEKQLCQFVHSTPYTPAITESIELKPKQIASRRVKIPRGIIPHDTLHVTLGVDLGKYRGWWLGLAARANGQLHCFDYASFDIDSDTYTEPNAIELALKEFYEICETGWPIFGSTDIRKPDQVWIDAGYQAPAVFSFIRWLGTHSVKARYMPVIGRGTGQLQRIYENPKKVGSRIVQIGDQWHCSKVPKHRAYEITFDADYYKDQIHNHWQIETDTPGALDLFMASEREHTRLARDMTNEKKVTEFIANKGWVTKWVRLGRQHWLDCGAMARAALSRCGWRVPTAGQINKGV